MGYLYRPKLKKRSDETEARESSVWWCQYFVDGVRKRESTGTGKETEARRFLKEREGRVAIGQPILPRVERIRYEEIAEDLREHYRTTGRRDMDEAEFRLKHLGTFFGQRRVSAIGSAEITSYTAARQAEGAANGTINRELATLSRMLRVAYKNGKLHRLPVIERLAEAAPRAGFFEEDQYRAVVKRLPETLQAAMAIAHTYGWRVKSEVLPLERRHLDLDAGTLRLDPGMAKNDEPRVVYLTPEVKALLTEQVARVDRLQRQLGRIVPYLFPRGGKGTRAGERWRDFRGSWEEACKGAGVPGRIPHDFRRTAVRNLERAGVARSVAMKITGHKTEAVYRRYAIVSDADLREAARKLAADAR